MPNVAQNACLRGWQRADSAVHCGVDAGSFKIQITNKKPDLRQKDCAGVVNGKAKVDICGVCKGNGKCPKVRMVAFNCAAHRSLGQCSMALRHSD